MKNNTSIKQTPAPAGPDHIEIVDPNLRMGFAQVPRPVLRAKNLSDKAKLVYALLLDYAWSSGSCFPGQARLASDLHATERTVQRALTELRDYRLVSWRRRGVMKTNVYFILPLAECPHLELLAPATAPQESDTTKTSSQDPTPLSHQEATPVSQEEYSVEYTQSEEYKEVEDSKIRKVAEDRQSHTDRSSRPPSGAMSVGDVLRRSEPVLTRRGRSRSRPETLDQDYQRIQDYIADRAREFNDTAPLKSSTARAYRLYKRSGVSIQAFVERIFQARALTQERTASITKVAEDPEYRVKRKTKMAYFFAVLEDQLGLAPAKRSGSDSSKARREPVNPEVDGEADPYEPYVMH